MDKYTGKKLDGRYEIRELIGVGGMAIVYKAYDTVDDCTVAIKILKEEFSNNEEFIRRFKNESKAIAVLSHQNIVKVFDVSFGDRIQYIVMEYIDGITLKEYISQQKVIQWSEAVHFTVQILKALQHAHDKGIVHRDIKPQNIMLLQDGRIKVTDFGIARFSNRETRTMTDKAIGSVHYIAPEQARGDVTDGKTDIYSVGVMLYEMLTGKLPFEADNAVSVAIMQLQTDPIMPKSINPSIPDGLEEITLKAMQKEPRQRYSSAEEMLSAIEAFRQNPSIRFQYRYFVDDTPTKYVDAIKVAKRPSATQSYDNSYDDDYNDDAPVKSKVPATKIAVGISIAFFVTIIVFGFIVLLKGCESAGVDDVDVPNLIGFKYTDVISNGSYNFKFEPVFKYDGSKPDGVILDQTPTADSGKQIKATSTITLTVNSQTATVKVPSIVGLTEENAIKKLSSENLIYVIERVYSDTVPKGNVMNCAPQEGESVQVGATVAIRISDGAKPKDVIIPSDIIGKEYNIVEAQLNALGLTVIREDVENNDYDEGLVIGIDPVQGVIVKEGYVVTVKVSKGGMKERTAYIDIDMPTEVTKFVEMTIEVDGVLVDTKTIRPVYSSSYTFELTGRKGSNIVYVYLDGSEYRRYKVNFDVATPTIVTLVENPYVAPEPINPDDPDNSDNPDDPDNPDNPDDPDDPNNSSNPDDEPNNSDDSSTTSRSHWWD